MPMIYIRDLVIEAKHGVHPNEKTTAQRFNVNVELTINTARSAVSDDLADTLNWSQLRLTIIDTVQNNSFNLIERLAQEVAERILSDKRVQKISLSIEKLDAFKTGVPGVKLEIDNH